MSFFYEILTADDPQDLVVTVTEYIEAGYKPLGGVSVTCYRNEEGEQKFYYVQAMMKRER